MRGPPATPASDGTVTIEKCLLKLWHCEILNFKLGSFGFQYAETTAPITAIATEPARNAFVIVFGWRTFLRHVMEREHRTVVCYDAVYL